MNQDQLGGFIRSVMMLFSGWAISFGFTNEQWVSISGGVVAIATVIWSIYSNSKSSMIDSVASMPEVEKVIVSPDKVFSTEHPKVVAR